VLALASGETRKKNPSMRRALIIAAAIGVLSSTYASAQSWCGKRSSNAANARERSAKGGMCFPDHAQNARRAVPGVALLSTMGD
jgi:hypothetical protein